jgi:hypothetical protein
MITALSVHPKAGVEVFGFGTILELAELRAAVDTLCSKGRIKSGIRRMICLGEGPEVSIRYSKV